MPTSTGILPTKPKFPVTRPAKTPGKPAGLIPKKVMARPKFGKPYMTTRYVSPEQAKKIKVPKGKEREREKETKLLSKGGVFFLVEETVRDTLLKYPIKQYKIEVYGLGANRVKRILESSIGKEIHTESLNGNTFLKTENIQVKVYPNDVAKNSVQRRDFTINSVMYDLLEKRLFDPTNTGIQDIKDGTLRIVNKDLFRHRPDKVLKLLYLKKKLNFSIEQETEKLAKEVNPDSIPLQIKQIWQKRTKLLEEKTT